MRTHAFNRLAVASLGLWTTLAQAQTPVTVPVPRAHHALFYDAARARVMLTGGVATRGRQLTPLNDLWSFDGKRWVSHDTSGQRMSAARVAVDGRGRILSFGGWRDSAVGDLRVLENNQWRLLGVHPSIVSADAGFVFDKARDRMVAFGTPANNVTAFEMWEYDGARWAKQPASPPPERVEPAVVYDERRGRIIVFGGQAPRVNGADARMLGDTWEFDGARWVRRDVRGPAGRMMAGHTYDAKRGLVLVFGGTDGTADRGDLWAWDGVSWKQLAEHGPEPRVMGHLAYDRLRDRVVLFGGRRGYTDLGDTWEWDGDRWRQVAP